MSTVGLSLDIFCRDLLRELSATYEVVVISSPDSHLEAAGAREGVRTIGIGMERGMAPLADLVALVRLTRVLRRERPLMIHTITPKAGLLGMMAAKLSGVPLRVHTFTGLLFPTATGLRRRILWLTDRITCACATHVIPEGEGVKTDLIGSGVTKKPLRVLGHGNIRGVDTDFFSPDDEIRGKALGLRARLGIPPAAKTAVFIGRFVADKGLRELIDAFFLLDRSDFHLLLVGDAEQSKNTVAIPKHPRIHLSGGWTDDVRPWLSAADFHVLPSYREGFPNTVLEAGAMAIPSIVTDVNGSREIISDGLNGFVVAPRSAEALRTAMAKLLDTPGLACTMGCEARANVERNFRRDYVSSCLQEFYRRIIAEMP